MGRWLSRAVDVLRIAFFAAAVVMTVQMMLKIGNQTRMTIVDLPMNIVYGLCLFGFAAMCWRSVQVARIHWRRGYSVLERPESTIARPLSATSGHPMLKIFFLLFMAGGIPVGDRHGRRLAGLHPGGRAACRRFVVIHRMVSGIDSFPLLAVPFFILAGNLMNNAGITTRIYNFALALVGWLKGGLGHVNVLGSVIFAGMSGTAIADAAGLGTIEIKAMKEHGYSTEFAVGVTAASATLGPIIPPSLPFVIYGMMANVSVGALFLAGILPGVLLAILMMLTVAYYAHKNNWGGDIKFSQHAAVQGAGRAGCRGRLAAAAVAADRPSWARRRSSTVFGGAGRAVRARQDLPLRGGAADHDAGAADRRHDHRPLHAHRRRHRRLRVGHGPGLRLVPHAVAGRCSSRSAWTPWRPPPPCSSSSPPRRSSAGC